MTTTSELTSAGGQAQGATAAASGTTLNTPGTESDTLQSLPAPATTIAPAGPAQSGTLARALTEGMRRALAADDRVMVMGEDVGRLGGVFRITDGLHAEFGDLRVLDTPLAESGIVGTAIGLAMRGYRPVCEIQFDGFVFPAFDQITTQLAKLPSRLAGRRPLPIVIRIPFGGAIGAVEHHSESPEALFAHTAGLRVVTPSSPQDAYEMIQAAIACPDPVIFLEPKSKYWTSGPLDLTAGYYGDAAISSCAPESHAAQAAGREDSTTTRATYDSAAPGSASALTLAESPSDAEAVRASAAWRLLNTAAIVRGGSDVTIAGYGPTVATALAAAEDAARTGVSAEVIDLRAISPLDIDTVAASVDRTGRLVVVHEAPVYFGSGAELAAEVAERCFYRLEAPVQRVGGYHTPYPPAKVEHDYLPSVARVRAAIDRALAF